MMAIYVIAEPDKGLRAKIEATYPARDVFFAGTEPTARLFEHLDGVDRLLIPEGSSPLIDYLASGQGFLRFTGTTFAALKIVRPVRDGKW